MTRRKNNHQPVAWLDVWKKIQGTVMRLNAPDVVQQAALSVEIAWWTKGATMYLVIPDNLRDFIEQNMDYFKPILWPFMLSHHCTKLIYKRHLENGTQTH